MNAPKAVSKRLVGVEAEVLEMALLQLDDGPPETKAYVVERLRQALSPETPAENGYSAFEAMALAGWEVTYNASPDTLGTDDWNRRTRWIMKRSHAPYEFEDKRRIWFASTFPELAQIAEDYGYGPRAL